MDITLFARVGSCKRASSEVPGITLKASACTAIQVPGPGRRSRDSGKDGSIARWSLVKNRTDPGFLAQMECGRRRSAEVLSGQDERAEFDSYQNLHCRVLVEKLAEHFIDR